MPLRVNIFILLLWFFCFPVAASASIEDSLAANVAPNVIAGIVGSSLARADEAFVISRINRGDPKNLKGMYGEAVTHKYLERTGGWSKISQANKSQGIDGIYLKYNKNGLPKAMMVSEAKYDRSQTKQTKDGMQFGSKWIEKRLFDEGKRYKSVAGDIQVRSRSISNRSKFDVIEVQLSDRSKVRFWREAYNKGEWYFEGKAEQLSAAKRRTQSIGNYIEKAANGEIRYRSVLVNSKSIQNDLQLAIKQKDGTKVSRAKPIPKEALGKIISKSENKQLFEKELAKSIREHNPHITQREALQLSKKLSAKYSIQEILDLSKDVKYSSFVKQDLIRAGRAGLGIGIFFELMNTAMTGDFSPEKSALNIVLPETISSGASAMTHGAKYAVNRGVGQKTIVRITQSDILQKAINLNAARLAINTGITKRSLGFFGTPITFVVFTVYDYLRGGITFTKAVTYNGLFFAEAGLHALTSKAMVGFALAKGTASTGTAISTLSGAAAKNAAMAYLGKASASVGLSGGVAGGAMVVTAGSAVVATAVIAAGMLAYAKYEDGQENKRYEYFAESLLNGAALTKSVERWGVK